MADDEDPALPGPAPPGEAPLAAGPGPSAAPLPQGGGEGEGQESEMTGPSRVASLGFARPPIPPGRGHFGAPSGSAADTFTQFQGSGQASAVAMTTPQEHSSVPGAGDKRAREDQQDASLPGTKRQKARPLPDFHDTGESNAPLAPRKTLRLSDMPLLPTLANSCPPGFALGMATDSRDQSEAKDMPRLPPLRSMPLRGRVEEAWADLKPSRTHPLPPKRSSQDLAQEGLDTQLSRRSSNRAWSETPNRTNVGGSNYRVYSNCGRGGGSNDLGDPDPMVEDGPMAEDSALAIYPPPPSSAPPLQTQEVLMDSWEPPVKSQARAGADTWDSQGASKPSSGRTASGRRGVREACSSQTRRGGTPLLGKTSTGRSNPRMLQGGAQPLGAEGFMPDFRRSGALPIDARLTGQDSRMAEIQGHGQGYAVPPLGPSPTLLQGHAGVQQSSNTLRTCAVMDRVPAASGPSPAFGRPGQGGLFGAGLAPATLPFQGVGGVLQIPTEMQPFLTSVINVLGQVGATGITPQISAGAANVRMQASKYLMLSIFQAQALPPPAPVVAARSGLDQGPASLSTSILQSLFGHGHSPAEAIYHPHLGEANSVEGPPPREEEEQQGSKLVRPIALRSFSPNGDPHRVVLDLGGLPKGQADNPFARMANTRPPPLNTKVLEPQLPKPKASAPALSQQPKRRTASAGATPLGSARVAASTAVPERDAVETLLAMTEHSGGIGVGATLRSPRDADPDPDPIFGAHVPRGRRNRGAGSAHAQPVPATAEQQAPPRMGVSPLAQVAAGEADEAGPSSPPSAASPLPVGPRPGSAPGTSAWAAVAPSLPPAYPHAPNHSPFDSTNFVPLESRQSAPHSVFRPFIPSLPSWLPPPLPPASSAPSPVIGSSHRVACGPQGTSGPQLRYIGAGGSGSGGERAHFHLRGGAPPQRQPNVSVQVVGATPGMAMSTPRPTGAISLQEQTSKYKIPPLVSLVKSAGPNRIYTYRAGMNVARPAAVGWSGVAPPPPNPPPDPASSDSAG